MYCHACSLFPSCAARTNPTTAPRGVSRPNGSGVGASCAGVEDLGEGTGGVCAAARAAPARQTIASARAALEVVENIFAITVRLASLLRTMILSPTPHCTQTNHVSENIARLLFVY